MKRLPVRKIEEDEDAQIMGIPLYILLIVIIAAVSLAAILGFMVTTEPSIDEIRIHDVYHGEHEDVGDIYGYQSSVYVEDIDEDSGIAYYRGSERPDPEDPDGTLSPAEGYDTHLVVTIYNEEGSPMSGVDVEAEGAGVSSVGTTNASGIVELSLDGCRLRRNQNNAQITVTGTYEGLIGSESVRTNIWVQRP